MRNFSFSRNICRLFSALKSYNTGLPRHRLGDPTRGRHYLVNTHTHTHIHWRTSVFTVVSFLLSLVHSRLTQLEIVPYYFIIMLARLARSNAVGRTRVTRNRRNSTIFYYDNNLPVYDRNSKRGQRAKSVRRLCRGRPRVLNFIIFNRYVNKFDWCGKFCLCI